MSKHALVALLGVFIAAMPFLGFPNSWDNIFFALAGAVLVVLALLLRIERFGGLASTFGQSEFGHDSAFAESRPSGDAVPQETDDTSTHEHEARTTAEGGGEA